MFDVDEYAIFLGCGEERLVVCEGFDSWFGDQDVDAALDSVEGDGVVGCVWCEDCDCIAGGEGVDGGFVSFGVFGVVRRVGIEGCVEVVVDERDVFMEMFT